ncbi:hypothetical protein JDBV08_00490 [Mycobacterium phage jiawei]|nr:hypothetical protein JDBV08_00490 [Mycobacterium phage jiawei]
MSGITNAQLASQVSSLVSTWRSREAQYKAWIGGTADGGPEGDGRYPLTDGKGLTYMVESPARLRDMVSGPAALAIAAKDAIAQTEAVVLAEGARVDTVAAGVDANRRAALDARDQAQLAREVVQGIEARVLQYRNEAVGAREGTLADLTQVQELAEDVVYQTGLAENAAFDAIAAADRAATFDPALFAPVSHQHTWDQITGKPLTFTPTAHGHAWGEITGKPSVFTPATHTHLWADITDKPTTFAPAAHSHAWSEITGKPTSFTPSAHGHAWTEITGKPATFAPDAHSHTWDSITGKPTSFTPSGHTHPWSQITGAPAITALTASTQHSGSTVVQRDGNGYVFLNYLNTTDNVVGSGVTGVIVKQGNDYHRTANADAVRGFLGLGSAAYANSGDFASAGAVNGKMDRAVNTWITSSEGYPRFHFSSNNRSYYRSANGHEWRNSDDVNIATLDNGGYLNLPYNLQSAAASGYVRIPGTPFILQWGELPVASRREGSVYVAFPVAFPNACFQITANIVNSLSNGTYDNWMQRVSVNQFGASMYLQGTGDQTRSMGICWMAIGY